MLEDVLFIFTQGHFVVSNPLFIILSIEKFLQSFAFPFSILNYHFKALIFKVDETKLPEIVQHLAPIRTGPNKTLIFPVNLAVESDRILDQILDRTIDSELQGREPYFIKKMTQVRLKMHKT